MTEIKNATGRELPLSAIYDAATIGDMVAILGRDELPKSDTLVCFKAGTTTPAIFLVHGLFGHVFELQELATTISTARAVYGLQPRGLDGLEPPNESVESMADHYVREIRRVQARGPYVLVGYSFGGLVALEMASRLRAGGDQVAFLGFIDSFPVGRCWPLSSRLELWSIKIWFWSRAIARMGPARAIPLVWGWVGKPSERGLQAAATAHFERGVALSEPLRRVREAAYNAFKGHTPSRYDGCVTFLRAGTLRHFPGNPARAWRRFVSSMTVHTIPGDHYSMINTHSDTLASVLCSCIDGALETPARSSSDLVTGAWAGQLSDAPVEI